MLELSKLSDEGVGFSKQEDASDFARISNPEKMQEWISNRYPSFAAINKSAQKLCWKDILEALNQIESEIFAPLYNTIKWRIKTLMAYESKSMLKDTDLIRIMASTDHSLYYKICAVLLKAKVFDGDTLQNSHRVVFHEKMDYLRNKEDYNSLKLKNPIEPLLILKNYNGEDEIYKYDNYTTNLSPSNFVIKGGDLKEKFPHLYNRINLEFMISGEISVNNMKVTKQEFNEFELILGDRIEFLKS